MVFRTTLSAVVLLLSLGFCRARTGPIVVGQTFIASSTDPTSGSVPWALISHGIAEKLFTVNKDGDTVSQIAESVSKIDDDGHIWEVTLKSNYKFSDGTVVDAQHVADALNELNEKNDGARSSLGSMTVTVPSADNSLLVRIESERPTHVMGAVLAEWPFVIYTRMGDDFVFTGPYVVEHFAEGDHIDLIPNQFYPQAEERPQIEILMFEDGDALAKAFKKNQVDVGFHLPIHTLPELRSIDGVHIKTFEVGYHYMVIHNTRVESPLSDIRVRRAVDIAMDRNALSQALAGGHGTRSFFPDFTPYYTDDSDPHGDKAEAESLLSLAGWQLVDGKRMKDGEELTLDLVAYPHRPGLVIMQPEIADQLGALGITVRTVLTSFDWDETQAIIDNADFDLLMWAQHTLPAGDPSWFLNAFFRTDGGSNYAAFSSTEIDAMLDTLATIEGHEERVSTAESVHNKITESIPISNLVTPAWHVGLSDRVENDYEPHGSDYYVIRADTFLGVETKKSSAAAKSLSISVLVLLTTMYKMF